MPRKAVPSRIRRWIAEIVLASGWPSQGRLRYEDLRGSWKVGDTFEVGDRQPSVGYIFVTAELDVVAVAIASPSQSRRGRHHIAARYADPVLEMLPKLLADG